VAGELTVEDSFLTGSYRRHTLITPLSQADVDVVVVLNRSYKRDGARAVLNMVKSSLATAYSEPTEISRNGQAVTIKFSDFLIDVVPAFVQPWLLGGGWTICDSGSDSWIATNPKRHVEISAQANELHDGELVPCIKQLKAWNRTAGKPLRSFHIEALAWSVFGRSSWHYAPMSNDWESVSYFFQKAPRKLGDSQPDPAGTGKDLSAYLRGTARREAVSNMEAAYRRCIRADGAYNDDDIAVMHQSYARVFGNYYPVKAMT
jgi:hypothetical protein